MLCSRTSWLILKHVSSAASRRAQTESTPRCALEAHSEALFRSERPSRPRTSFLDLLVDQRTSGSHARSRAAIVRPEQQLASVLPLSSSEDPPAPGSRPPSFLIMSRTSTWDLSTPRPPLKGVDNPVEKLGICCPVTVGITVCFSDLTVELARTTRHFSTHLLAPSLSLQATLDRSGQAPPFSTVHPQHLGHRPHGMNRHKIFNPLPLQSSLRRSSTFECGPY